MSSFDPIAHNQQALLQGIQTVEQKLSTLTERLAAVERALQAAREENAALRSQIQVLQVKVFPMEGLLASLQHDVRSQKA